MDAFQLWCWKRLLRIPWAEGRSNQSILKEISPEYSLEGLMLKLKLQYFGRLMRRADSFKKTLTLGRIEGGRRGRQSMRGLDGIAQTHVHRVGDAIQPFHPLSSPSPPVSNLSSIRIFSMGSVLRIRWPKYWRFRFSINPSNEYSGLISFRMDLLDLLAVQGTLKSLLQHHNSKASILWHSAFFIVKLSNPYMTTGKPIALTRQTFVGKVMSLLFNMLSSLFIIFLQRSKCLLISWL